MLSSEYNLYDIIKFPVSTEKSSKLLEASEAQYTFFVHQKATKTDIKKAIEHIYSVKVDRVNVLNVHGKTKIFKNKSGTRSNRRKALVTLTPGHKIDYQNLGA